MFVARFPFTQKSTKAKKKTELPLTSVNFASAGTLSQAKAKRRVLMMFMFCLLAKDDFNTSKVSIP